MTNPLIQNSKDVPSTSIPLEKSIEQSKIKIDFNKNSSLFWLQISEALFVDYKYGWNIGKYGNNGEIKTQELFKKLSECIITMITNECAKKGLSSENFMLHFEILQSILQLIAKEIENKKIPDYNPKSLFAVLHGFIESSVDSLKIE